MKKKALSFWLGGFLCAAAMAAAVNAPAEVLDNMDFFSDFELLANLEILEDDPQENYLVAVSTAPAVSTAAPAAFAPAEPVKISTSTGRSYEKP
ncbi:MAG: hypothetical protein A2234_00600 [Elusimicrobia bacterium RIFOXYA2_FULL_58_8]|nr:MAG: hypothetical protein A2285_06500 [Elusimicrobia bacterium RIFOXYA12_FULL_57_11]OGS12713.1 MAG: hypothetical protein A2234_00600 [Elusimicrobia bacterium RIFOXYA2_FULL_58_8]